MGNKGKGTSPVVTFGLGFLLMGFIAIGFSYWYFELRVVEAPTVPTVDPTRPQIMDLTRPWHISLIDTVGDCTNQEGDILVYTTAGGLYENITIENGVAISTRPYTSGERYNLRVAADGFVTVWASATVPKGSSAQDAYLYSKTSIIDLGTWSPRAVSPAGVFLTDVDNGAEENLAKSAGTRPTVTFEIRNTEDDSGWMESRDPLLNRDYKTVFYLVLENGNFEDIIVSGLSGARYESRTTRRTWYVNIPTASLIREVDATGTVVKSGVYQITATLDLAGWTDDTAVGCRYGIATYTSADYYALYGDWGSPSVQTQAAFLVTQ